jgi:hypothetical protein
MFSFNDVILFIYTLIQINNLPLESSATLSQSYPVSIVQEDDHPSPETTFISSQPVDETLIPSPHISPLQSVAGLFTVLTQLNPCSKTQF